MMTTHNKDSPAQFDQGHKEVDNKSLKVLLIEDSLTATRHVQNMIAEARSSQFNPEFESANRLSSGLECIDNGGADVVLLDLSLPDSDGLETFMKLQTYSPSVPIVVMSGLEDESLAVMAVQNGAQDYLVKGQVDSNLLKRCILYAIQRKQAEEALRKARDELDIRVKERTAQLADANEVLRMEIKERMQAEEETSRYAKRMDTLYAVSSTVVQNLDMDELLKRSLEKVVEVMGTDYGSIFLLDVEARVLLKKAYQGSHDDTISKITIIDLSDDELEQLRQCKEPRITVSQKGDTILFKPILDMLEKDRVQSFITLPLWVRGEPQGVMILGNPKDHEFSSDEIEMLTAIQNQVSVGVENAKLLERTRSLSITDELTGLCNRRHFYKTLDVEVDRIKRYGGRFSIVMIDLDGFKAYNDKYGHLAGDSGLKLFAQTLTVSLRKSDISFRYGGDEFVMILPATSDEGAKSVLNRLKTLWEEISKDQYGIEEHAIGFSAGVAEFPKDAETGDALLFLADTALYYCKRMAGGRFALASELGGRYEGFMDPTTLDQVYALAATVDSRDPSTYGHSKRVSTIVEIIARKMGLAEDEVLNLRAAGLLHDIGKVGVPDAILTKPDKLTAEEYTIIKKHSEEGARIVSRMKGLEYIVPLIRHHHEWYDGKGYPDGIKGEEIPVGARIISIADAFDTMTTTRVYREAIPHEYACEELKRCSGTQFDPALVDTFIQALKDNEDI